MAPELVYEAQGKQVRFPLANDVVTIGRDPSNDVVIDRQTVSRRHAKLCRDGEAWRITDLGSLCGTRLNETDATDRALRDGDRIHLHKFTLTFRDGDSTGPLTHSGALDPGTVVQSAVDFSALASKPNVEHLQRLLALVTKASKVIVAQPSLDDVFNQVLDVVFEHLPVERGCIMLWDEERQELVSRCEKQKSGPAGDGSPIRFSQTIAEKVYNDKVGLLTTDAQMDGRFADGKSVVALGIRSAMAAPLWRGDAVEGLIYVDTPLRTQAFNNFDLDLLSALGNHVAVAIEQSRLQRSIVEQQIVRRRLERYHSPAVVERIASIGEGSGDVLMADERDVTVLFADVVGFTQYCEKMKPRDVADNLNRYFSEMAEMVFRHEGMLDKFIGDCLMAVFGAPFESDDHAQRAVAAALDMRAALEELNAPLRPDQQMRFRVGIHSGLVVAGDIGSIRRSDYTVLGATVNLASRLEGLAEPGQIVISEQTQRAVRDRYETRPLGEHQPKGISERVRCFELVSPIE